MPDAVVLSSDALDGYEGGLRLTTDTGSETYEYTFGYSELPTVDDGQIDEPGTAVLIERRKQEHGSTEWEDLDLSLTETVKEDLESRGYEATTE